MGLLRITNAAITPGIHPHKVNKKTIGIDPHPLSNTAKGGKKIDNKTLQILINKNKLNIIIIGSFICYYVTLLLDVFFRNRRCKTNLSAYQHKAKFVLAYKNQGVKSQKEVISFSKGLYSICRLNFRLILGRC